MVAFPPTLLMLFDCSSKRIISCRELTHSSIQSTEQPPEPAPAIQLASGSEESQKQTAHSPVKGELSGLRIRLKGTFRHIFTEEKT